MLSISAILFLLAACTTNNVEDMASGYPEDLVPILRTTCAASGCHTEQSAPGAGGLNLATWEALFQGANGGSAVVPYAPENSFLLHSINTDSSRGSVLSPTMPLNQPALPAETYERIHQWIADGARNLLGEERFPEQPTRQKWYVGHYECDQVAVFDAESGQIMRYVDVGIFPDRSEEVADIRLTPDGQDWLLIYRNTHSFIQRYNSLTDEKVADITLGNYFWNAVDFSPDSRFAFVVSNYWRRLAIVDLTTNALTGPATTFPVSVLGPYMHPTRAEVYLVRNRDQSLYVLDYTAAGTLENQRIVDLVQGQPAGGAAGLVPQQVSFLPDGSRFFVSCWNSREIRVYDGATQTLTDILPMPHSPGKMAYSASTNRLFISCTEDEDSWGGAPLKRGSVVVVDVAANAVERVLYTGYQPHEMLVDEARGVLVVLNRNSEPLGPASHHASTCGEKNGYLTLVDLQSLELRSGYKMEVLANPIAVSGKW